MIKPIFFLSFCLLASGCGSGESEFENFDRVLSVNCIGKDGLPVSIVADGDRVVFGGDLEATNVRHKGSRYKFELDGSTWQVNFTRKTVIKGMGGMICW